MGWMRFKAGLDLFRSGSELVCYLGIVDDAAAAADSLTSCLVAVGRLACGAAEAAGLMPPQQSLSLQDTTEDLK